MAEFAEALQRGRAKGIAAVTNVLWEQAVLERNTTAVLFYLKCRGGWQEKPAESEVSTKEVALEIRQFIQSADTITISTDIADAKSAKVNPPVDGS